MPFATQLNARFGDEDIKMRLLIVVAVLAILVVLLPGGLGWNLFPSGLVLTAVCFALLVWLFARRGTPPL